MDAPPAAAYPFGAHCVRPKRTSSRFVNSRPQILRPKVYMLIPSLISLYFGMQ